MFNSKPQSSEAQTSEVPTTTPTNFDKVIDLFKSSVITQAIIVCIFGVGTFLLLLTDRPVPEWLVVTLGTVIGFYFGGRIMQQQMQIAGKVVK